MAADADYSDSPRSMVAEETAVAAGADAARGWLVVRDGTPLSDAIERQQSILAPEARKPFLSGFLNALDGALSKPETPQTGGPAQTPADLGHELPALIRRALSDVCADFRARRIIDRTPRGRESLIRLCNIADEIEDDDPGLVFGAQVADQIRGNDEAARHARDALIALWPRRLRLVASVEREILNTTEPVEQSES